MEYIYHILIMIEIYLGLVYVLNLVVGYRGLVVLCSAIFYGTGAYATALFMKFFGFSFLTSMALGAFLSGIFSFLIGLVALRFKNDYFVLITLAFQIVFFTILYNWLEITNGPYGISGIPSPTVLGWKVDSTKDYLVLFGILLFFATGIIFTIYKSPFGLALRALRDDESAAKMLGKPSYIYSMKAFVLFGIFASIPGSWYAVYVHYIDPTSFTLDESIFILAILLVGGSGNRLGPLLGVLLMIILPELLRFVGMPDAIAANFRQILYGIILILLMYFRPEGLWGEYQIK